MKRYIYADYAATAPMLPEAREAMIKVMGPEYANPSSLHAPGRRAKGVLEAARAEIAQCIGARAEEIFFTSGGSESNNWVMQIMQHYGRIVTSSIEHLSILNALYQIRERFAWPEPRYVKPDAAGRIESDKLEKLLTGRISIASIMFANNEIGTVEPVADLADMAHRHGARFHTDAVQAVGHVPIDVNRLGVDMLSASAHKFGGPRGIGFLYIRDAEMSYALIAGGHQERGLRAGTENLPAIAGMAEALKISCNRMEETTARLNGMTQRFYEIINNELDGVVPIGDRQNRLPGHISTAFCGFPGESLMHCLNLKGIAISTGSACNSQSTEISHVLRSIRLRKSLAESTVRISFGALNEADDAEKVALAIVSILKR